MRLHLLRHWIFSFIYNLTIMHRIRISLSTDAEDNRIRTKPQKPFYICIFFFPGNQIYKANGHGPAFSGYNLRISPLGCCQQTHSIG